MTHAEIAALRSTAHPLRLRILSLLTGAEMSAAEVARELGIAHASASYHLRVLADAGEVVASGEERIRGGVAKRYRHPWREVHEGTRGQWGREAHVRAMAAELIRRYDQRAKPTRTQLCDAELWVTPEIWAHVLELVEEAATTLHDRAQPPRTEGTIPVNLTIAAFGLDLEGGR